MILITGAAGFIGSKVAQELIRLGHKTITIDNLSTGYRENIPEETIFIEGNCGDKKVISQLNKYEIEGIIHIAGQSSGEVSFKDPKYDLESNTLSTILLLQYAAEKGIKKFVYASSMSVYGNSQNLPVKESQTAVPESFYACGKLASEHYMRIFKGEGRALTALRLFNVYGPGQNLENLNQGMLSIYLAQALFHDKILVKGSKDRFRDFVYIDDAVEAFLLSYFIESPGFNILNVCSGTSTKVSEIIGAIKSSAGIDCPVEYVEGTPGDQFGIYGDYSKLQESLNWKPKISFSEGLGLMVEWAKGK
jgi:UDP-glucose 4-epimerase